MLLRHGSSKSWKACNKDDALNPNIEYLRLKLDAADNTEGNGFAADFGKVDTAAAGRHGDVTAVAEEQDNPPHEAVKAEPEAERAYRADLDASTVDNATKFGTASEGEPRVGGD